MVYPEAAVAATVLEADRDADLAAHYILAVYASAVQVPVCLLLGSLLSNCT